MMKVNPMNYLYYTSCQDKKMKGTLHVNSAHIQIQSRLTVIFLFILSIIMITSFIALASAEAVNVNIFPIDSKPYNLTYGEWTAKWWQWALSTPQDNNPINDKTGKSCALNQKGPVWFLTGTTGGSVVRECNIPAGRAILLTPLNIECSYAEFPALKTEKELRDCAKWPGASVEVTIDGLKIQNLDKYETQSPIFNVVLPQNNLFGAPAGPTQAVSGGWWILLKPLSPGKHTIHASGNVIDNPTTGTQSFATELTYHLTVQ
jgi:hypothetical protein